MAKIDINGLVRHIYNIIEDDLDTEIMERPASCKTYSKLIADIIAENIAESMAKRNFRIYNGELMMFTGDKYEPIADNIISSVVNLVTTVYGIRPDYKLEIMNHSIRTLRCLLINGKNFNPLRSIISVENGVIDIRNNKFYEHSEEFETELTLPVTYDKNAKCPNWHKFLDSVLPDKNNQKVLQEFFGFCFLDRKELSIEAAMFMSGGGSNGKSTAVNALVSVLGAENTTNYTIQQLASDNHREYYLANLNGKLANLITDMSDADFSSGEYKRLVSGESFQCRKPAGQPYVADKIPPLIILTNNIPLSNDQTEGFYRRNLIVPFDVTITKEQQDRTLGSKLKAEKSGIFNWIIEGTLRLIEQEGKFTNSESVEEACHKAKIESSSLLLFLQDEGYSSKGEVELQSISLKATFDKYREYCKDNGYHAYAKKKFSKIIESEGYKIKRKADGMYITFKTANIENVSPENQNINDENLPF